MTSFVCSKCGLAPDRTQDGRLSRWEVAKAIAFSTVISDMSEHLGQSASELIGGGESTNTSPSNSKSSVVATLPLALSEMLSPSARRKTSTLESHKIIQAGGSEFTLNTRFPRRQELVWL